MSSLNYELNLKEERVSIGYETLGKRYLFNLRGFLSGDGETFVTDSSAIDDSNELSQTEKIGIMKYVSRERQNGNPRIVFKGNN